MDLIQLHYLLQMQIVQNISYMLNTLRSYLLQLQILILIRLIFVNLQLSSSTMLRAIMFPPASGNLKVVTPQHQQPLILLYFMIMLAPFNVKLTVYNELYNNTKVLIDTVKIYTTPVADFQYVISGNVVTFTNSTLNGVSYLWNFGDNTTSTAFAPVHTYTSSGTFEVVLTATNICGNNSKTKTITISAEPNAEFSRRCC